jgi:NADPH:quinone reductase-like Zn-dependent oxidoreductase
MAREPTASSKSCQGAAAKDWLAASEAVLRSTRYSGAPERKWKSKTSSGVGGIRKSGTAHKALGAAAVVNYVETPDRHEKMVELTDGREADCVVEIGGPGTLTNSLKALVVGGHISLIGSSLSRSGIMLDPMLLGGRGMTLGSISVGSRADFEAMNRAIGLHRLQPVVDRVFPFDEAPDAYR